MRKISLNWDINVFRTKYKAFGGEKDFVMDLNLHVLTRATLIYMYILLITENCKPCQW